MRKARQHMHGLNLITRDLPLQHLAIRVIQVPLLNQSVTLHHNKLLKLGVVPVLTLMMPGFEILIETCPAFRVCTNSVKLPLSSTFIFKGNAPSPHTKDILRCNTSIIHTTTPGLVLHKGLNLLNQCTISHIPEPLTLNHEP